MPYAPNWTEYKAMEFHEASDMAAQLTAMSKNGDWRLVPLSLGYEENKIVVLLQRQTWDGRED